MLSWYLYTVSTLLLFGSAWNIKHVFVNCSKFKFKFEIWKSRIIIGSLEVSCFQKESIPAARWYFRLTYLSSCIQSLSRTLYFCLYMYLSILLSFLVTERIDSLKMPKYGHFIALCDIFFHYEYCLSTPGMLRRTNKKNTARLNFSSHWCVLA